MTEPLIHSPPEVDSPSTALKLVLEKSREVKKRIATCSTDLVIANEIVTRRLAETSTPLSAHDLMVSSEEINERVQEGAEDLQGINQSLAQGIDELTKTESSLTDTREALGRTETALTVADGERKKFESEALHDLKTDLPNRRLFDDRLAQAIEAAKRHCWTLAVMFLDLDNFKGINDALGHGVGDEVLSEVALGLLLNTRGEDTACRNGGDEFLVLLVDPQGRENIARIANVISRYIGAIKEEARLGVSISASIGIAIYPENGTTADELIKNADSAMYKAKEMKSRYVFANASLV